MNKITVQYRSKYSSYIYENKIFYFIFLNDSLYSACLISKVMRLMKELLK